ncbi:MAG: Holliday junction resolvase RuvX [Gammaproteobacteria bacterium]
MAFDFGHKRIGVAVGQDLTGTARALETITVRNGRIDWEAIAALVDAWRPEQFVLGRPRTADGAPHVLDHAIERFARRLQGRYGRPVAFIDEHLSSHAARADPECARAGLDAVAARLILESWFASDASCRRRGDDTSGRNT